MCIRDRDYIVFIHNGQIVFQMEKDTLLERFAVCKCGKGELSRFEQAHILGHRESRFDLEFLVDNAPLVRKAYPELLTEPASIDDIDVYKRQSKTLSGNPILPI